MKEEKELEGILTEMYDEVGDQDEADQSQDPNQALMQSIAQPVEIYHDLGKRVGYLVIIKGEYYVSDAESADGIGGSKSGYTKFTSSRVGRLDRTENGMLQIELK